MVNELKNIKQEILNRLYLAKGKTVSGVRLSDALNISRVAVWKHITALKESGVEIESCPKGYFLPAPDDLLHPFCFRSDIAKNISHFQALDSTMDMAKVLAKKDAPHLSVVIAEDQTMGRGRLNRKWISARGGLWLTLILKPETPPPLAYIYNFAASLSLSRSLKRLFDVNVSVKWPNDLLLNGKKLAGLLSEMETRGDMVEFVNIGIGMNVNNHPQKHEPNAISLTDVLHKTVSRKLILETFLDDFKNRIHPLDSHRIIELWKEQTSTIGSQVRIETLGDVYEGLAVDVDETGALLIRDTTGETKKIIYGDCFHT
ncbi:MAG: biotin--[acetyl-CoA-carboxylase] ligase [Desulfobacula sp.]|nr:biotin--[acetyl-CoA-carboxylase] ligase [Desulfobacula sp.]